MASNEHRACAACRTQKVRCILDDQTSSTECQRCLRVGRPCYFTPIHKRKQRVRTDARVAELEKEMRRMRQELLQKEESTGHGSSGQSIRPAGPPGLWYKDSLEPSQNTLANGSSSTDSSGRQRNLTTVWPSGRSAERSTKDFRDVVDRGVISLATARQLLAVYRKDLFFHYPIVALEGSITVEELRRTKPVLFLSIIAAAAGKDQPDLSATLDEEVLQMYATHSLVRSEKSLETVQALLISSVWYHPPNKFGQLKYYEYIHMAATMAMDIGIGSRPAAHRRGRQHQASSNVHPAEDATNPDLSMAPRAANTGLDTASIESRRTYLACYILCAGVAMSLRRPCMLRVSAYIRDCVDVLERTPGVPTDSTLVAWVRLVMLGEEISTAFSYDDAGGVALLTDVRTQMMLREFERRLTAWHAGVASSSDGTGFLLLMYYTTRLYLFEVALHVDHSPEDFRAPYQMGGVHPLSDADQVPTDILVDSVLECISTSHALMDVFVAMDVESLRALPVFGYVRVSFAAFVLAKLCLSSAYPHSRIGMVLDKRSLKIEEYMDRTILHVRNVIGTYKSRVPSIFLALLFKLRQWCLNPVAMIQMSEQEPELAITNSVRANVEKPGGSMIDLEELRVEEDISSADASPQAAVNMPTGSLQSLTVDAIGIASSSRVGGTHELGSHDMVTESFGGPSMIEAGPDPVSSIQTGDFIGTTSDPNLAFGELAFPEGGLTGLDMWADADLTAMQDNIFGWPDDTNFGC